jgi:hypothetical protein
MAELLTCSFTGCAEQRGHAARRGWRGLIIEDHLYLQSSQTKSLKVIILADASLKRVKIWIKHTLE